MGNFHSLEAVARGSETQLQVSENLNIALEGLMLLGAISHRLL